MMKKLTFEIEFLSDIVLQASSNTEGNIELLDFIPGSNFLGMVAKNYDKFENSFDIFHSGKVRFGDATILYNDQKTYKIPLAYFHKKLDNSIIYNHHFLSDQDFKDLGQLKQKRNGYITKDLKTIEIDYNYSQKSAYDKKHRRSKDSSMYGYSSIPKGTTWQFEIKYSDISQEDLELLKSSIIGQQRLGKSKSAQYGLINVQETKNNQESIEDNNIQDIVILYANSRIALINTEGNPTYDLRYICNGLTDENILYEKSQLRISNFTPYNGARATKDYEKVCINKGSVIVLKDISQSQLKQIKDGVGAYLSEGFGEFLINPVFVLQKDGFNLLTKENNGSKSKEKRKKIEKTFSNKIIQFLVNKHNNDIENLEIIDEVTDFIKANKSIYAQSMNSQWRAIRSICTNSTNETIKENVKKYISHGVAKEKWKGVKTIKLLNAIENSKNPLILTKLLTTQMPKEKNND